ncbi:uncharacterized protein [Nicotiana tomentosiformis]|uniref:uncharacterized protein n=1 Tax=Nicotiana tomentosiformis TaxID=4098 RepID=UPI00388C9094
MLIGENSGSGGGGGIIRNHHGDMVLSLVESYGHCRNSMAKAKAVLRGCRIGINLGLLNVIVEPDSLLIVNMINRRMKPSWQIKHVLEQIWDITKIGNFKFVHVRAALKLDQYGLPNFIQTKKKPIFSQ